MYPQAKGNPGSDGFSRYPNLVTWRSQPVASSIGKSNGVGTVPGEYGWDATDLVQGWLERKPNHGLALWSAVEADSGWRGFASRESRSPPSPPRLVVTLRP